MRILWLHAMGNRLRRRQSAIELETALEIHLGSGEVLTWDADFGCPETIRNQAWDAVVLGPSILMDRTRARPRGYLERFIACAERSDLVLAFPQDEYVNPDATDRWLTQWGANAVFSVFPEKAAALYPQSVESGARVERAYTGYISEAFIRHAEAVRQETSKVHNLVGYRASIPLPIFGELGWDKVEIGEKFLEMSRAIRGIPTDISTDRDDTLHGDSWFSFLATLSWTLSTPSGSSLLDRHGLISKCIDLKLRGISADRWTRQMVAECIPQDVGEQSFETISPRHFEAALLGTGQISFPGSYGGVLEPGEDFVLLERDFSNFDEVISQVSDTAHLSEIAGRAREKVLGHSGLRATDLARRVVELIEEMRGAPGAAVPPMPVRDSSILLRNRLERTDAWKAPIKNFVDTQFMSLKQKVPGLKRLVYEIGQLERLIRTRHR